jgi:2-hydroxy-6-oxonona-2,4-dienedioate hydrolase
MEIMTMNSLNTSLVLLFMGMLASGIWVYFAYERDLLASLDRLQGASQTVETSCGPIEYAELGNGPALLIVHGAGGGFYQGMALGQSFSSSGSRVIAMSRFGYLQTPLPADASPSAQADAHAALLDALGIPRAAIFAGSAGAPSAMQFAISYPERCTALILAVPMVYMPPGVTASALQISPLALKLVMIIARSDFAFWMGYKIAPKMMIKTILATPPATVSAATKDEQIRISSTLDHLLPVSSRSQGILNDARISIALNRFNLEKIDRPTLVLSVRDDLYQTFASSQYTARQIPGAKFVGYDNGGHMWVGHQHEVIAEVEAFLKANSCV